VFWAVRARTMPPPRATGMRVEDLHIEPARSAAGRSLSHADLERAWAEGRALGLQEAIEAARSLRPVSIC
jgi:hypothetical protein